MFHNAHNLDIDTDPSQPRMNKIICTIGPSTQSVEAMMELIDAGMSVVRMNFSHGTHEYHGATIANARLAAERRGRPDIAIALDTKGPEIRTGKFRGGEARMVAGGHVKVTTNAEVKEDGTAERFFVDYKRLPKVIPVGGTILIDDGNLTLRVMEKGDDFVMCEVLNSHVLTNTKSCNLPRCEIDLPAVSDTDKSDLAFGARSKVDFVFASFVRSAANVRDVRAALVAGDPEHGPLVKIIAKIENHQGVAHFDEILGAADGIMVARGDLGSEIPAEKVFVAQKMMISRCNVAGKPVICATQMLESMTINPRPTRAEVTDVANAVLDGTDAVMLSGETAKGKYPVVAVETMARICREAQHATAVRIFYDSVRQQLPRPVSVEEAIAMSAVTLTFELPIKVIVVLSTSGKTARLVARFHPMCPIIMSTSSLITARQVALIRGVFPVLTTIASSSGELRARRLKEAIEQAKLWRMCAKDDMVVCVHADDNTKGYANLTRVMIAE